MTPATTALPETPTAVAAPAAAGATTATVPVATALPDAAPPAAPPASSARHILFGASAMAMLGASTAVSARLTNYPVLGGQAVRYTVAAGALFAILRHRERRAGSGSGFGAGSSAGSGLRSGSELETGSGLRTEPAPVIPLPRPRLTTRDRLLLVGVSLSGLVLFNIFVIAALRRTDSATLSSVVACSPLFLALFGPLVTRTRRALSLPLALAAAATVAVGSALVQGFGHGTATGLLCAVVVLVCEVLFSLLAVPVLPKLGELRLSAYVTAIAVPLLLLAGVVTDGRAVLRMPTLAEAGALTYLSLVMTVIAFLLWYRALGGLGPQRAGLLIGLVPITACAASAVLGVGVPGAAQLAGVLLVVAGVVGGLAAGSRGERRALSPGALTAEP